MVSAFLINQTSIRPSAHENPHTTIVAAAAISLIVFVIEENITWLYLNAHNLRWGASRGATNLYRRLHIIALNTIPSLHINRL